MIPAVEILIVLLVFVVIGYVLLWAIRAWGLPEPVKVLIGLILLLLFVIYVFRVFAAGPVFVR